MSDDERYPTDEELEKIRTWPLTDPVGWLNYARSLWHIVEWGWPIENPAGSFVLVSTGGWSGNEEIIYAMQEAHYGLLWHMVWEQTRKGGHYTFLIPGATKLKNYDDYEHVAP